MLIICEGLGFAADLAGVARHPVRLEHPGKVVYSLHDFSWYPPAGQPRSAYFDQMHRAGGYILTEGIAPLWIGEFGNDTRSLDYFGRAASPAAGWWLSVEAWLTDTTWTGASRRSTPRRPGAPSRSPASAGPAGAIPNRGPARPGLTRRGNPQVLDILRVVPPRAGPGIIP